MTELTEAEIDALCAATGYLRTDARRMEWVTKAVERIIDARLAPIRALAAEWSEPESHRAGAYVRERDAAARIRAALDAASAPVSAQQDHDGTEGQGEGCETCRGEVWCPTCEDRRKAALPPLVHNHLPYRPPCNERVVDGQLRGACLNDDGSPR